MLIILLAVLSPFTAAQPEALTLVAPADDFYVALDALPSWASPDALYELYTCLQAHVEPDPASPLASLLDAPAVIHFVPLDSSAPFPHGTKGFAGESGAAALWCEKPMTPGAQRACTLLAQPDEILGDFPIRLALAALCGQDETCDPAEALGTTAHEMAHLLGAVDGLRCPAHEDYNPLAVLPADPTDTYWFYGVQGVFELRPAGVVWDALCGRCAASTDPILCAEFAALPIISDRRAAGSP